jgi:hypothetical protein
MSNNTLAMDHEGADLEGTPVRHGIVCANSTSNSISSLQDHIVDVSLHQTLGACESSDASADDNNVAFFHYALFR